MLLMLIIFHGEAPVKDRIPRLYFFQSHVNFGMEVFDLVLSCGFKYANMDLLTPQAKEKKPKGRGMALDSPQ